MKIAYLALVPAFLLWSCNEGQPKQEQSLSLARKAFTTKILKQKTGSGELESPPPGLFTLVQYPTPLGKMPAYLSRVPDDGKKHAAMIWITGGFGNDISDVWSPQEPDNDQSAAAIREAGIVMMYPAQRGGNTSPGVDESSFGEIDDIIAAAKYLAAQPGVDPARIYLGGHSTGGTKVILAAETSPVFRAIFSFGPVARVTDYGPENLTFDVNNSDEAGVRSPVLWLKSLTQPLFVFEGSGGNAPGLEELEGEARVKQVSLAHFYLVQGKDHFAVLAPVCKVIAAKILQDTGRACNIEIGYGELE